MPRIGRRAVIAVLVVLLLVTAALLVLGTTGANVANVIAMPFSALAVLVALLTYQRQFESAPANDLATPASENVAAPDEDVDHEPRSRSVILVAGCLGGVALVLAGGLVFFGPSRDLPAGGPAQTPCSSQSITVTDHAVTLAPCRQVHLSLPTRWVLEARAAGADCELGFYPEALPSRSVRGQTVLLHGRAPAGTATLDSTCSSTIRPGDDAPAALPLTVAPTARSGATPLFEATGAITIEIAGDRQKCNASLFEDSGSKIGSRATPGRPLRINVDGNYWVESEVDGCSLSVRK